LAHCFFETAAENPAEGNAQIWVTVQKLIKIGLGQGPDVGFRNGIGGGGMSFAGEKGYFAKEVALFQLLQQHRPAHGVGPMLYLAIANKIHFVAGPALVIDGAAALVATGLQARRQVVELHSRQTG
jgi:hypothetical protein